MSFKKFPKLQNDWPKTESSFGPSPITTKIVKDEDLARILAASTAEEATCIGHTVEKPPDWEEFKFAVKGCAIHLKYEQNPELAELLSTTPSFDPEANEWDEFTRKVTEQYRFQISRANGFLEKRSFYWGRTFESRHQLGKAGRALKTLEYDEDF